MTNAVFLPSYILPAFIELLMFVTISVSVVMPGIDRWSRRYFIVFYSINVIIGLVFILDMMTYMNPEEYDISVTLPFIELFLYSLPPLLLTPYLLYCCGKSWRKSPIFRVAAVMWVVNFIMIIIAQFTRFFYYTLPNGQTFLGEGYALLFIPLIAISLINLITVIIYRQNLSKKYYIAFLVYIIPTIIATIIHSLIFAIVAINIALCIGSFTMYVLILTDQINQYTRQQADIVNQQANIMVLQMRPHFIYNTMTSIYYLCDQNPKKAQQVILDFTTYLRKNFNAIASNDMIPFSEELEHVKAYLAVEIAQFEDNLFVDYDINHTQFALPPLTLQPLVENAIKHGLDPDSDPLHILVRTISTESSSVIIVKDNGPGLATEEVFEANNALTNTQKRLKMMCNGSITLSTPPEGGVIVQVDIPLEKKA